jgi:hypothetical protein
VAVIEDPPGEETQWDWVELPDPPAQWGWGGTAHLLVGVLSHSGRWRGVLAESEDQAHLVADLDRITRALGGHVAGGGLVGAHRQVEQRERPPYAG